MATSPNRFFTRRRVLQWGAGLVGVGGALGLYAWRVEPHWVNLVERDLPIDRLPDRMAGKRMVQISDLHVGAIVDFDYLARSLKEISRLKPDFTVITGDLMHCRGDEHVDEVGRLFDGFDPGPLGGYAIFGNHDYGLNWSDLKAADRLAATMNSRNIRVLRNEIAHVGDLQLVGLDDLWSSRFHPATPKSQWDAKDAILTLCHNPDAVDLPEMADWPGWVLSGHTHGGQVKPPFLPPPMLPVKNRRYTQGEFSLGNDRWLYINPGLGYLKRVRFNVPPEITRFTLQRA